MKSPLRLAILALIVDYSGELDTAAIAAHLYPPPKPQRSHP